MISTYAAISHGSTVEQVAQTLSTELGAKLFPPQPWHAQKPRRTSSSTTRHAKGLSQAYELIYECYLSYKPLIGGLCCTLCRSWPLEIRSEVVCVVVLFLLLFFLVFSFLLLFSCFG